MNDLSAEALDEILALQILVAWAGEGRCEPARLGWWSTDLVDRKLDERLAALKAAGGEPQAPDRGRGRVRWWLRGGA